MVRRSPVQIDNFEVKENKYTIDGLVDKLKKIISVRLAISKEAYGILLSGGIDSSVLALLTKPFGIPCFVIGKSLDSPDVSAAMKLAEEKDLCLYIHIPDLNEIEVTKQELTTKFRISLYPGDENVLIALQFCSKFVSSLFATDGIDELMGGYWWHTNRTHEYPTAENAFEYFWGKLEPVHLTPMFESAKQAGVNIYWVYLQPYFTKYISRIPIKDRIKNGINKAVWKQVAKKIGVPQWVIDRPKRGFIDALS